MSNFTEQQVNEVVLKQNLEAGQTFQQEKVIGQLQIGGGSSSMEPPPDKEAPKEEGIVDMVKKNVKTQVAQEVATYALKKAIEKLPSLIASLS